MEPNQMFDFLASLPWWTWLLLLIAYVIVFGKKKMWEYEVKFPLKEGVGRGEIELECYQKQEPSIEVEFTLESLYQDRPVEIYLSDHLIFTVPKEKNTGSYFSVEETLSIDEPKEGDEVSVKINGAIVFSGLLVLD